LPDFVDLRRVIQGANRAEILLELGHVVLLADHRVDDLACVAAPAPRWREHEGRTTAHALATLRRHVVESGADRGCSILIVVSVGGARDHFDVADLVG